MIFFISLAVQHERLPRKLPMQQQAQVPTKDIYSRSIFSQQLSLDLLNTPSPTIQNNTRFLYDTAHSPPMLNSPMLLSPTLMSNPQHFPVVYNTSPKRQHQNTTHESRLPAKCMKTDFNNNDNVKITPSKLETAPSPPVTPLSKNSAEYSIDALLKHTNTNDEKNTKIPLPTATLTPPQSPQHHQLIDPKYNDRVQESLLRILETAISRMYMTPAFRVLSNELKSKLLENCWFRLFLLGIFEVNFPLESLNLYIQNMVKIAPNQVDLYALNKMDFGLRKLFEHNIDETELAFLKDLAVFQPSKYFKNKVIFDIINNP